MLELLLRPVVDVLDGDAGAEANAVLGDLLLVDLLQLGEPAGDLLELRLDELLPIARRLELGVLADVALGDGLLDLLGQLVVQLVLKLFGLGIQLFDKVFQHSILRPR